MARPTGGWLYPREDYAGPAGGGLPTGGTTGQALTKNSATDYDAGWSTISSGGGGGSLGNVLAYVATNTAVVENPDVAADTLVNGLSTTFTLAATTTVRIRFAVRAAKSGFIVLSLYDNGVKLQPTAGGGAAPPPAGWYLSSMNGFERNNQQGTFECVVSLAAGSHTIGVYHAASSNLNSITWYERVLSIEPLIITTAVAELAYCRVRKSTSTVTVVGADTAFSFDTEDSDSSGLHSTVTNPERVTIAVAGKYVISGGWTNGIASSGVQVVGIFINGVRAASSGIAPGGNGADLGVTCVRELVAGDYIELRYYSSVSTTIAATAWSPRLEVAQVGMAAASAPAEVLISEQVIAVAAASVPFATIAQIYRDLRIVVRGRGTAAATNINPAVQFNGDTGANYDYEVLGAAGSGTFGAPQIAQTSAAMGWLPAASSPAGVGGTFEMLIGDYRGVFQKNGVGVSNLKQVNATGSFLAGTVSIWWRNTAPITALTVLAGSGNFDVGTVVSLYGRY